MSRQQDQHYTSQGEYWKELAVRAQDGDKRAYAELLRDILPFVKKRIAPGVANPDWVDDIAQEVLISVHKSLDSYQADRPFRPWLMAIISFRKTDFLRKHYKRKKTKELSQGHKETFETHVTESPRSGELKDIEAALDSLPDKQKKIFKMMKIEGYSAKEVAKEMGMSVSAVKVSAHRSANKLKDMLS